MIETAYNNTDFEPLRIDFAFNHSHHERSTVSPS
jgi:hypothetical protein